MERDIDSPVGDSGPDLRQLHGGSRPPLPEHGGVAITLAPLFRRAHNAARFGRQFDPGGASQPVAAHIVVAHVIVHRVANLDESGVIGLRKNPSHRHPLGGMRVIIGDTFTIGHSDGVRHRELGERGDGAGINGRGEGGELT